MKFFSPSGNHFFLDKKTLLDAQTKQPKTYVRPLEGGDSIKVFDFVPIRTLRWTRDGKALSLLCETAIRVELFCNHSTEKKEL